VGKTISELAPFVRMTVAYRKLWRRRRMNVSSIKMIVRIGYLVSP
jgi:hypothetical protein